MNTYYPIGVSGCYEEETAKNYAEFTRVSTNPDGFRELKEYGQKKILGWTLTGIAGLAVIITGTILTVKKIKKEK